VWELFLFQSCPEEIQATAVYMGFEHQRNLQKQHRSVYLEYYLRCAPGETPALANMLSLRAAVEGLEDVFEAFLGWRGLFGELLRCFRNNDFDIFSVDYVASQIYTALAHMPELAREACDTSVTSAQWLSYFTDHFAAIKSRMSFEGFQRYERFKATSPHPSLLPAPSGPSVVPPAQLMPPPVQQSPVRELSESQLAFFCTQVCVKDIVGHFKLQKGVHMPCGRECVRRHMSELSRSPVNIDAAIDQINAVVRERKLALKVVAAVRADNSVVSPCRV
jgi:hypothetical protein